MKTSYILATVLVVGVVIYVLVKRTTPKATVQPKTSNDIFGSVSNAISGFSNVLKLIPPSASNRTTPGIGSGAAYDEGYNPNLTAATSYGSTESGTGIVDGGT